MIKILELPLEQDVGALYQYLRSNGVPLRIIESSGRQEVWVPDERFRELTLELYQRFLQDPQVRAKLAHLQSGDREFARMPAGVSWSDWLLSFWRVPVTWLGLLGIAVVAVLMQFRAGEHWVLNLMFADPFLSDYATGSERLAGLQHTLAAGEWWRLLTPAFIHLSAMHLVFNSLWFWYLGIRIERNHGSMLLLTMILITGVGSNLAQYLVSGPGFGGMSGVIYGFFGYAGWQTLRNPRDPVALQPALLIFALVWLVIGYSGLPILPGDGKFANTAHSGGLLLGILFAFARDLFKPARKS